MQIEIQLSDTISNLYTLVGWGTYTGTHFYYSHIPQSAPPQRWDGWHEKSKATRINKCQINHLYSRPSAVGTHLFYQKSDTAAAALPILTPCTSAANSLLPGLERVHNKRSTTHQIQETSVLPHIPTALKRKQCKTPDTAHPNFVCATSPSHLNKPPRPDPPLKDPPDPHI